MNKALYGPLCSILVGCIFFVMAGIEIHNGTITMGRYVEAIVYAKTRPGVFWSAVIIQIFLGICIIVMGIAQFLKD